MENWKDIDRLKQAVRANPGDAMAHFNLGLAYVMLDRFDEAIEPFKKSIRIKPDHAETHFNLGVTYCSLGRFDEAIESFKEAIRIKPNDANAYYHRGYVYLKKNNLDQAISDLTQAINIDSRHAQAYLYRGIAYDKKKNSDQAISDLTHAINIDPHLADAYAFRGMAYLTKYNPDQAISDLTQAIRINPRDAGAYHDRGFAYFHKNQFNKAWEDVHMAQRLGRSIEPHFLNELKKALPEKYNTKDIEGEINKEQLIVAEAMDNQNNIEKYSQICAEIILGNTATFLSDLAESSFSIDECFIIAREFLSLELHFSDRIIFGLFGAEAREKLMKIIITHIAVRVDNAKETMLDGMMNRLTLDNFAVYLKRLRDVPSAEGLIEDYNRAEIEYSKYKLTPEFNDNYTAGVIEWEFGKKVTVLLRQENNASCIELMATKAKATFYKLLVIFKEAKDKYIK